MTTETKPTEAQKKLLHNQFYSTFNKVGANIEYHNRRMNFFKKWNLSLKFIDAIVGVGGLVLIGFYCKTDIGAEISFWVAGLAVLLLFLNVLFDFSKKEETHRWLISSYMEIDKLIPSMNIKDWPNLSGEDYKEFKNILSNIVEKENSLQKEEYPLLDFLYCLSDISEKQGKEGVSIIFRVKWCQFFLANYFSMPNSRTKLLEKFRVEEEKKKQQQENNKPKTSQPNTNLTTP